MVLERQRELDGAVVGEVAERDPDEGEALAARSTASRRRAACAPSRGSSASARSPRTGCARASRASSRRSAAGASPCGTRGGPLAAAGASRSTIATTVASMSSGDLGVRRPSARCEPIDRRRRPRTRRGSRLCASAWMWRPAARPSSSTSARSSAPATSRTVARPAARSLREVTGPTPQRYSMGRGWRKPSSLPGGTTSRPSGFATALATFARNLVRATPTVIGSPTLAPHLAAQPARDLLGRAEHRLHPARVEERLVDRERLDHRRGLLEDLEHGLAGLGVGGHPGRHDHRLRAPPPSLGAAHPALHAVLLRLVAGGEHDPAADDHRAAPQLRGVTLLDRRVEGVEVRVEDGRPLTRTHVRMPGKSLESTTRPRCPRIGLRPPRLTQ